MPFCERCKDAFSGSFSNNDTWKDSKANLCTNCCEKLLSKIDSSIKDYKTNLASLAEYESRLKDNVFQKCEKSSFSGLKELKSLQEELASLNKLTKESQENLSVLNKTFFALLEDSVSLKYDINESLSSLSDLEDKLSYTLHKTKRASMQGVLKSVFPINCSRSDPSISHMKFLECTSESNYILESDYPLKSNCILESNCALGQMAFLFEAIRSILNFELSRYKIILMGCFSYIEDCTKAQVYNLYHKERYFKILKYPLCELDSALKVFLNCLLQMENYAKAIRPNFSMPNPIQNFRIGLKEYNASPMYHKNLLALILENLKSFVEIC